MYLPWYTPQWASVENWFAIIKNKLRNGELLETINLSLKKIYIHIYSWMKCLTLNSIRKMFANFKRNEAEDNQLSNFS